MKEFWIHIELNHIYKDYSPQVNLKSKKIVNFIIDS
jgi:hypothetical protein